MVVVVVMIEGVGGDGGGDDNSGSGGDDRGSWWCIKCKGLHGRTIADGVSAKFRNGTAAEASRG